MLDLIHLLFFVIAVVLAFIASRRTMVSPLTTLVVVCLVTGIVLLAARNKNMKMTLDQERNISASALEDKSIQLVNCGKELEKKKKDYGGLESQIKSLSAEKETLTGEVDRLKAEVARHSDLSANVQQLQGALAAAKQESERLQADANDAKLKIEKLEMEKASLQTTVGDLQKKVEAAEVAKNSAEQAARSAAEVAAKAAEVAKAHAADAAAAAAAAAPKEEPKKEANVQAAAPAA